jgi:hypothetical protein
LRAIVKRFFATTADVLADTNPALARQLWWGGAGYGARQPARRVLLESAGRPRASMYVRRTHLEDGERVQCGPLCGCPRCGINSPTRLAGCVGNRSRTSLRQT